MALGDGQQRGARRGGQAGRQHQRGAAADAAGHPQCSGHLVGGQGDQRQVGSAVHQIGQGA